MAGQQRQLLRGRGEQDDQVHDGRPRGGAPGPRGGRGGRHHRGGGCVHPRQRRGSHWRRHQGPRAQVQEEGGSRAQAQVKAQAADGGGGGRRGRRDRRGAQPAGAGG